MHIAWNMQEFWQISDDSGVTVESGLKLLYLEFRKTCEKRVTIVQAKWRSGRVSHQCRMRNFAVWLFSVHIKYLMSRKACSIHSITITITIQSSRLVISDNVYQYCITKSYTWAVIRLKLLLLSDLGMICRLELMDFSGAVDLMSHRWIFEVFVPHWCRNLLLDHLVDFNQAKLLFAHSLSPCWLHEMSEENKDCS